MSGRWHQTVNNPSLYGREDVLGNAIRSLDLEDPIAQLWNKYGKLEQNGPPPHYNLALPYYRPLKIQAKTTAGNFVKKASMNLDLMCGEKLRPEICRECIELMNCTFNSDDHDMIAQHISAWRDLYQKYQIPLMSEMEEFLDWTPSDHFHRFETAVYKLFLVRLKGGYYLLLDIIKALRETVSDYCVTRADEMRISYKP